MSGGTGADPNLVFTDVDALVIGPAVAEVSASFDRFWNSELAFPANAMLGREPTAEEINGKRGALVAFVAEQSDSAYLRALQDSKLAEQIRKDEVRYDWGEVHVVHDAPEKVTADRSERIYHIAPQLRPYFEGVGEELSIISPYFVPGKEGTAFLSDFVARGVRVVTNSLSSTDVPVVHSGYARYRKDLLRAGVELYEMKPRSGKTTKRWAGSRLTGSSKASLHSKAFIFDRKQIFIGSFNLDPRSVHENTEIGVVLTSPELAGRIGPQIDEAVDRIAYRLALEIDSSEREQIVWQEPLIGGGRNTESSLTLISGNDFLWASWACYPANRSFEGRTAGSPHADRFGTAGVGDTSPVAVIG